MCMRTIIRHLAHLKVFRRLLGHLQRVHGWCHMHGTSVANLPPPSAIVPSGGPVPDIRPPPLLRRRTCQRMQPPTAGGQRVGGPPAAAQGAAAAAVFMEWRGNWTLQREVLSRRDGEPSGTFTGTAAFEPTVQQHEYLYTEQGVFSIGRGQQQRRYSASRRYIYAWDEGRRQIDSFFVARAAERDYFFHTLQFLPMADSAAASACANDCSGAALQARGDHWCRNDLYSAAYTFEFCGGSMSCFEVVWTVCGPRHDYTSTAVYERCT